MRLVRGADVSGGRYLPGIWVSGGSWRVGRPGLAQPVGDGDARSRGFHALPIDASVAGHRHVGEQRVGEHRVHGHGVGGPGRAGRHAEEPVLRVDGPQLPVLVEPHPRDVVTDALHLIARQRRLHHCHVGLAARARERGGHVPLPAPRVSHTQNLNANESKKYGHRTVC